MGQQHSRQKSRPPFSMETGFDEIRNKYFKEELFNELLNIKSSKHIDKIFSSIEQIAQKEGVKLSTSQLRNIYSKVSKDKAALKMLRPKLAYAAARQENEGAKKVIALFDRLIQKVKKDEEAQNFHFFMESFVAYHKLYGNKK